MSLANEPESGPAVETVTLAEAKDFANITIVETDPIVQTFISFARRYAEDRTGRVFVHQTWKEYLDAFPDDGIVRPSKSPVSSVTSIKYVDTDGVEQTLTEAAGDYQTDVISEPCRIQPVYNGSWPTVRGDTLNAITVEFVAGYGAAAADVPERWKTAIKLAVKHIYDFRESVIVGGKIDKATLMSLDALLTGDKLWQF